MIFLRSLLFTLTMVIVTPPYALFALATAPLAPLVRWRAISGWAHIMTWMARALLGIRYRVLGMENLPPGPAVILSKHQSAWETIAFQCIFPPHVFVLKRELLWIPFFGWGLGLMSPIAIDRSRGTKALKVLAERGARRFAEGFWILIFPEGTRVSAGTGGKYHVGGAWVATRLRAPVVPVAHNAGLYWGKNSFLKYPGEITVEIGKPIPTEGSSAETVNAKAREWIEARSAALCRP